MSLLRYLFIASLAAARLGGGCFDNQSVVPKDFLLIVDAELAARSVENLNVRIDANGQGQYDRYDTGGVIRSDTSDLVTYEPDQVIDTGEFRVDQEAVKKLWAAIKENRFFELTGDYRMAIGHSYAFIVVQAEGRRHQVFNIGMEVPEIKAIVEATVTVLPEGLDLEYREGYVRGTPR